MKLSRIAGTDIVRVALSMLVAAPTMAEEVMPAGLHGSVGLGVGVRPAYEGADERETRIAPNINLFYGDRSEEHTSNSSHNPASRMPSSA
jgi:outer membrane scaffolding protein for murein synthesis (MipA/OmpV family)